MLVSWSDIVYVRIINMWSKKHGISQMARFHVKGKDDFVAHVFTQSEAFHPVMKEVVSRKIPVLRETEQFNPHSRDIPH